MIKATVVGASGYTGAELMRILASHPGMEVAFATAGQYAGRPVASLYPSLAAEYPGDFTEYEPGLLEQCDVVFCGMPHGESARVVKEAYEAGKKVVDLSADFRLSAADYKKWYGMDHPFPELLDEAVYGLPELNRDRIAAARIVANPGCYPTSAILGLAPLAKAGLLGDGVIVDSKSGVSGAGRSLSLQTHYPQASGGIRPYGVEGHRHRPEIENSLEHLAGERVRVVFAPHLAPMSRGILSTMYARMTGGVDVTRVRSLYEEAYGGERFVQVLPACEYPQTKSVRGSNCCQLGLQAPHGSDTLVVMSVIDNLVKGASGQAVQCANLACDLDEWMGLDRVGLFP